MFERRLNILYVCVCAGLAIILARMAWLQVLGRTPEDPDAVLLRPLPLDEIPAYRGSIRDRNGTILARDVATLQVAVPYRELLLLHALNGGEMSPVELKILRTYARSRLSRARKQNGPYQEELAVLRRTPEEPVTPEERALLTRWLEQRLQDFSRATGQPADAIMARIENVVSNVHRIHAALPRISLIYEETIPHVILDNVNVETAAQIESNPLRFPEAIIQTGLRRELPLGNVAPHVIGYLGTAQRPQRGETPEDPNVVPGERIGITGIEKQYNAFLRGVPGIIHEETDPKTGMLQRKALFDAQPGHDVFLSLDVEAQRRAELELEGRTGAVVVMDIHTGELIVLASAPRYDNGDINASYRAAQEAPELRPFLSRATQDSVPSGSIIKPIVAMAAYDEGLSTGQSFHCAGSITVGGTRFGCTGQHDDISMQSAIAKSCNVYFFEAGRRAGAPAIANLAAKLGWGRKTGVDLPYEFAGHLPDPTRPGWYVGHTLNLSIGQGNLSVTPLQATVAMAAIANGGKVLRPRMLMRMTPDPDAEESAFIATPPPVEVALPAEALRIIRAGMRDASISGTARGEPRLARLHAAVKTGTAETPDPAVNFAWIAGFYPWDNPRYAFAMVVHRVPVHGGELGPNMANVLEAVGNE